MEGAKKDDLHFDNEYSRLIGEPLLCLVCCCEPDTPRSQPLLERRCSVPRCSQKQQPHRMDLGFFLSPVH